MAASNAAGHGTTVRACAAQRPSYRRGAPSPGRNRMLVDAPAMGGYNTTHDTLPTFHLHSSSEALGTCPIRQSSPESMARFCSCRLTDPRSATH